MIVVDEIGRKSEADAMLESLNSGVKIIASAHAASLEELSRRAPIRPFIENGVFDVFAGIILKDGERRIAVDLKK